MISRFKTIITQLFVGLLSRPTVWVLSALAKSQLSKNPLLRALGYLPFQAFDAILGFDALRYISHVSRREPKKKKGNRIKSASLRATLYLAAGKVISDKSKLIHAADYRAALAANELDHESQYTLAHQLFQSGNLTLACETFADLIDRTPNKFTLERQLQLFRDAGTTHFMLGKIDRANYFWGKAGALRRLILGAEDGPVYRIVGSSYFAAIGHVAMLDFYAKYNELFREEGSRFVSQVELSSVPGSYLCDRIGESGIKFIRNGALQKDYDRWAKRHGKRRWDHLSEAERFAHIDDFWEFEFPDGEIWGYTHAANKIQKEWERQKRPPLLSVTQSERSFINRALELLGVPKGAWYVCLHVREPGFHKGWNTLYPAMRDANVDDYLPAIERIVERGGWVVRMGDPSMKPLPSLPNVVDYANNPLKTPKTDILLTLGCRFFLGTNSGFATIPAIYGVPCVFTNWLPVGLPLWPSQDLMIPKEFWDKKQQRFLTLEEVFQTGLAFIQNWSDLPEGIELRDNTSDQICDLVDEAFETEFGKGSCGDYQSSYQNLADRHGSYTGSTLALSFGKQCSITEKSMEV